MAAFPHVVGAHTVPSQRVHGVSQLLPAWPQTVEHSLGQVGSGQAAQGPNNSHHDPQTSGSPGANSHMVMQSIAVGQTTPQFCASAVFDQHNTKTEIDVSITRKRVVDRIGGLR